MQLNDFENEKYTEYNLQMTEKNVFKTFQCHLF